MEIKRIRQFVLLAVLVFVTVSCDDSTVFSEVKTIDGGKWHVDNVLNFVVELDEEEAGEELVSEIIVRHTGQYEYQNLWMFVEQANGDTTVVDTVNVFAADQFGRWIGDSGIGSLYTIAAPFEMLEGDSVVVNVRQGMRMDEVGNVENVGIRVYKNGQE